MALVLPAVLAVLPASHATAQNAPRAWIHISPLAGAVAASVPGEAPRAAAAIQLEYSRILPMGAGIAAGYHFASSAPRAPGEGVGPWLEATFVYRYRLRFRGHVAPYAGPLVGGSLHDTGRPGAEERWITRWHFGGRAGVDIPVGRKWPAVRVEAAYRHSPSPSGLGGFDLTTALVGFRWSVPLL